MSEPRKIILDCDPGYDDAIAIILAGLSEKINLLGIVAVAGNQTLELTSKNAINIINYLNLKNIPVFKGMSQPIIKKLKTGELVHGKTGLDGVNIFKSENEDIKIQEKLGLNFIIETCLKNDKVTLVGIGPLTDIAMAIKIEPKIISHIDEIVIMGGAVKEGNASPAAEFNIYTDPHAAHIVFTSGIQIKMHVFETTIQADLDLKILERMKNLNTKSSKLFFECTNNLIKKFVSLGFGEHAFLHDPVIIAYLIDNNIVKFKHQYVNIDITDGPSNGRTNCYEPQFFPEYKPNAYVSTELNSEKFWDIIEEVLKKY